MITLKKKKDSKFRTDRLREKEKKKKKTAENVSLVLKPVTSGLPLAEFPSGVLEAVFFFSIRELA